METKFTAGPWRIESQTGSKGEHCYWSIYPVTEDGYRGSISDVSDAVNIEGITIEEAKANARLIATAPELYEALEKLLRSYRYIKPEHSIVSDAEKQAVAALAKATGEQS